VPDLSEFSQISQSERFVLKSRRDNLAPAGSALAQADILIDLLIFSQLDYFLDLFISKRLANLLEFDHSRVHLSYADFKRIDRKFIQLCR
jgi:hypothetical protein